MKKHNHYRVSSQIEGAKGKNTWFLHIARIVLAAVFIFSGFVKAVDPLGTVYKIEDYLIAFEGIFHHFLFAAFPLAILLILVELLIGFNLLFQVKLKWNLWAVFAFTVVMTGLTLYIAIYNPVKDCGCFGDALIIPNWTTFYKNLVFLALIILLLIFRNRFRQVFVAGVEWGFMIVFVLLSLGFMSYNLLNLPVIDFRPYKIGVNIAEGMEIPDGAPTDEYEYIFEYEKDGEVKEFSINALPDSSWSFVAQQSILISEGYKPPIEDFMILSSDYEDITYEVLAFEGKTIFILMYDLSKTSKKAMQKVKTYIDTQPQNVKIYALTASPSQKIEAFNELHKLNIPFCTMDPITLKTMVRANPGIMELENGVITGKLNGRSL